MILLWVGCTFGPTLPELDEVPIVADARCAPPREVVVGCVLDGDTFDVGGCGEPFERVRMLGVDAPEIEHAPEPEECWGDEAGEALRGRLAGRTVLLTFDQRCEDTYGRTLANVWDRDSLEVSVNEWMAEQGHVDIFEEAFGDGLLRPRLEAARDRAQARGLGLWGTCFP